MERITPSVIRSTRSSYGGSYGGGYSAPAPSAPVPPPAYTAPMGGGNQFAELDDDDGELPF